MQLNLRLSLHLAVLAFAAAPFSISAGVISWTDWTAGSGDTPSGTATGILNGITLSYAGDVSFVQTGSGTNYWTEPDALNRPYTGSALIDNAPTAAEMVAIKRTGITNTITFSSPVTNPIMALVSVGQPRGYSVSYDFSAAPTLVSEGRGYWGVDADGVSIVGTVLTGEEFHGAIQFMGTFNSLSWVNDPAENWHGFTIGVIPEPSALISLLTATSLILLLNRRRRNA